MSGTVEAGSAFQKTEPTPEAAFDVDGWISGIRPATKTVSISNKGALVEQIEELEVELAAEMRKQFLAATDEKPDDEALNAPTKGKQPPPSAEQLRLAQEIKALHDELGGSWVKVHLTALNMTRFNEMREVADGDEAEFSSSVLVEAATLEAPGQPRSLRLTQDQWKAMASKIEAGQYAELWITIQNLTVSTVVAPDFSPAASFALSGGKS